MAKEKKATEGAPKKRASRKKTVAAPTEPNTEQVQVQASSKNAAVPGDNGSSPDEVRRRAYEIWEQRGREHGKHEDDWYRAEQEIRGKSA